MVPPWPWNANTSGGCSVGFAGTTTRASRVRSSTAHSVRCGCGSAARARARTSRCMGGPRALLVARRVQDRDPDQFLVPVSEQHALVFQVDRFRRLLGPFQADVEDVGLL